MSSLSPVKLSRCTELKRLCLLVLVLGIRGSLAWTYIAWANPLAALPWAELQPAEPQDLVRMGRNSSKLMEQDVWRGLQLQVPCF